MHPTEFMLEWIGILIHRDGVLDDPHIISFNIIIRP
jgi:hypothetical protein